jgi:hypothetical protein
VARDRVDLSTSQLRRFLIMKATFYISIGVLIGVATVYLSIYASRVDSLRNYLQEKEAADKAIRDGRK